MRSNTAPFLNWKLRDHHGFDHPGLVEQFHAAGEQAFADGEAREFLALEHQHAVAAPREQRGRHRAGGAGADDQYVGSEALDVAVHGCARASRRAQRYEHHGVAAADREHQRAAALGDFAQFLESSRSVLRLAPSMRSPVRNSCDAALRGSTARICTPPSGASASVAPASPGMHGRGIAGCAGRRPSSRGAGAGLRQLGDDRRDVHAACDRG